MIFGMAPGTAALFTIPKLSIPAVINLEGFASSAVAITSLGFSQEANVQFMHTLRNLIYIYSFGERMGQIEVNGVAFYNVCNQGKSNGITDVLRYYAANSVSRRSASLVVNMAGSSVRGYLRAVRSSFSDSQLGLVGFSLIVASLPDMWFGAGA